MKLLHKCTTLVAVGLACTLLPAIGNASITTSGCLNLNVSCSLLELAGGGSIAIDGALFSNWSVDDASTTPADLSRIEVLPMNDQPANPGLRFNGNSQWAAVGLDLIDLSMRYTVAALDGRATSIGGSLDIDQTSFGLGNAGGFTGIAERLLGSNGSDLVADLYVFVDNLFGNAEPSDSGAFVAQALLLVETNILVNGDSAADTAALDRFTQRFSQVTQIPEPPMLTLTVLALGLAAISKRRLRRHT